MKLTFVDFTEESTSVSVKSTFDTSIIEIDTSDFISIYVKILSNGRRKVKC